MHDRLEKFLEFLVKKRIIVLIVIASILVISIAAGFLYQNKITKENEASVLFDDTWQKVAAIVNDIQNQPNQQYAPNAPTLPQAKALYEESLNDLNTLVTDYSSTISGAKAAVLIQFVIPLTNLNAILDDKTLITELSESDYLITIKRKHPNFWGTLVVVSQAMNAEQKLDFATALNFYQEALKQDKAKYLQDYLLIALARNNEILGNKDEAIKYYQQIEQKYPDSVWLSFAMGKAYLLSQSLESVTE